MSAVEVQDVFRVYSTPEGDAAALQGLSLRVEKGQIVVVLVHPKRACESRQGRADVPHAHTSHFGARNAAMRSAV